MKSPRHAAAPDILFRQLTRDTDESVTATQFLQLYRHSAALRHWLREDYSRDAKLRARVDALASGNRPLAVERFADLSAESLAWKEERRHLKARHDDHIYGGITCGEVEKLILRHLAGAIDQGVFLLAHEWRHAGEAAATSPVLARAAVALVDLALRSGQLRLLRHLAKAARFLAAYADKPKRRVTVGFADWWKLHTLLFILKHPHAAYRTRDLRAHLASHGLDVSAKEIRRFCTRHGIARDMRAGRPRKPKPRLADGPNFRPPPHTSPGKPAR